jgi:HAD superfamily hydrolase (TIGR01490 family)
MNLALFDFDGTLTTRDVYPGFLQYCSPRWRVALGWTLLALPWLGLKRGWVSPDFMRRAAAFVTFAGADAARVRAAGERYAREVIPALLRPEAMDRLAWHRAQGDRIVVVSGSMDVYLAPWCRVQGVELVCNEPAARGGRMTGFFASEDCANEGKVRRLRGLLDVGAHATVYAYGDSDADRAMLALAHRRWYRWREQPPLAAAA